MVNLPLGCIMGYANLAVAKTAAQRRGRGRWWDRRLGRWRRRIGRSGGRLSSLLHLPGPLGLLTGLRRAGDGGLRCRIGPTGLSRHTEIIGDLVAAKRDPVLLRVLVDAGRYLVKFSAGQNPENAVSGFD